MVINEEKLIFIYKGYGVRCPNKYYELDDKSIAIRATNIRGDVKYGIIDKEDFEKVKVCNWKLKKDALTYYLCNSRYGMIHRLIMNPDKNMQVDHMDGNGLNNSKSNLRVVTEEINSKNKHYVTGIYFDDVREPRFRVMWSENKKRKSKDFSLSKYKTLDQAYIEAKRYRLHQFTTFINNCPFSE